MANPTPLSAVIITKNEAAHIRSCIRSLKGVADEVVVVDSGSSDPTVAICRKLGARVFHHPWAGYSGQKNWAQGKARHPIIFSIDADERLGDELRASISLLKKNYDGRPYEVNRLTGWCGHWVRHCGWHPDWKTRIFDRRLARWEGGIHERLVFETLVAPGRLGGLLYHDSYGSVTDHIQQLNSFTSLMAQEAHRQGNRGGLFPLLSRPLRLFFTQYLQRRGFLDGYTGFAVTAISAFGEFLKQAKIIELERHAHRR